MDTCCIDKTSSVEPSEAINAMFNWYYDADVCYAFLANLVVHVVDYNDGLEEKLARCRWFRRGWTLQELLAPKKVTFYDQKWTFCGTRTEISRILSNIAQIWEVVFTPKWREFGTLGTRIMDEIPIAQRMSWAAQRETTRPEDMAPSWHIQCLNAYVVWRRRAEGLCAAAGGNSQTDD